MTNEIQKQEPMPLTAANPMQLMQACIQGGITKDNVEVFGKLLEYQRDMEASQAKKDFTAAFVALQTDMPKVVAMREVPGKDGTVRYHFAAFEDIMKQVQPLLQKHGFALSFSSAYPPGAPARIEITCSLMHVGGHLRSNPFAARLGEGPPHSSPAQGDGAAATYAKRFALCQCLNIVIEGMDDDARAISDVLPAEEALRIIDRVQKLKFTDNQCQSLVRWAGGKVTLEPDKTIAKASYFTIPSSRVPDVQRELRKKESGTVASVVAAAQGEELKDKDVPY